MNSDKNMNMSDDAMKKPEEKKEDKFICRTCGSESKGTPGTCCGGKPREKACAMCGHLHKEDGKCDCGCGM